MINVLVGLIAVLAAVMFFASAVAEEKGDPGISLEAKFCREPSTSGLPKREFRMIDDSRWEQILTLDLNEDGWCDRIQARFVTPRDIRPNGPADMHLTIYFGEEKGWKRVGKTGGDKSLTCDAQCVEHYYYEYIEGVYPVFVGADKKPILVLIGTNFHAQAEYLVRWNKKTMLPEHVPYQAINSQRVLDFVFQALKQSPSPYRGKDYCSGKAC